MVNIKRNEPEHCELPQPGSGSQFGDYDDTEIGTDLTLEWDSNDPDLHEHLIEALRANEAAKPTGQDDEDYYRYFKEAGLPDG